MTRLRTLAIALPALAVGALVFGSALGRADDGRRSYDPWDNTIAQAPPPPAHWSTPPVPPVPPVPPTPPTPPRVRRHGHGGSGSGVSVSIQNGQIQLDGIAALVDAQLASAQAQLDRATGMPPDVRARVQKHLNDLRKTMSKRLRHMNLGNLDKLGEELNRMGEELARDMEALGSDMASLGDQMRGNFSHAAPPRPPHQPHPMNPYPDVDDDDRDDVDVDVDVDVDDADVHDLGDLSLAPAQRDALGKLRIDAERRLADARRELDRAEAALRGQLDAVSATDAEIARAIDQVSTQEAAIRKVKILHWVNARRVLDDGQRKRVERAAKAKTK